MLYQVEVLARGICSSIPVQEVRIKGVEPSGLISQEDFNVRIREFALVIRLVKVKSHSQLSKVRHAGYGILGLSELLGLLEEEVQHQEERRSEEYPLHKCEASLSTKTFHELDDGKVVEARKSIPSNRKAGHELLRR